MSWLTVAEVKLHLGKDKAADDEELFGFIEAAESTVDSLIGIVRPPLEPLVDYQTGDGTQLLILARAPVAGITAVEVAGVTATQADLDDTSSVGWYALDDDMAAGFIRHTSCWSYNQTVKVTYYPGRLVIPGNVRLATLDIVLQLWQASQRGSAGDKPSYSPTEGSTVPRGFAVPQRARELLGLPKEGNAETLVG